MVIQNALFKGRKRLSGLTIPRATYTSPEIAQVGLTEAGAASAGIRVRVWRKDWAEVDRARAEGNPAGFVKILTAASSDRIVGATICGPHAGDLISEISVAMAGKIGLGQLASVIHPYPTRAEAIRQLGDSYNRTRLTPWVAAGFRKWLAWQRR